jgi:hypothetical protein
MFQDVPIDYHLSFSGYACGVPIRCQFANHPQGSVLAFEMYNRTIITLTRRNTQIQKLRLCIPTATHALHQQFMEKRGYMVLSV